MRHSNVDAGSGDRSQDSRPLRGVRKAFGDLKVRPKLMILHNLFFLVLAVAVFLAVHPPPSRRLALLFALAAIYAVAVLALELVILPLYVYRPLRLLLDADAATQRGDHDSELVPQRLIPGDEIGHIMRSRNATIALVVQEAWDLLALEDKSAAVRFTNAIDSGELVTGNPDRLIQVFVNLLRNALLAAPGSGIIVVTARRFRDGGRDWVELMVEDNGPGIPADVLPHIFEAFVTTRLDARGTGLGLAVAEAIVEQHGGAIRAANRPGGGACLTVRLPAASVPARGAA